MIFVECKPDYLLVRKLGYPKRQIIHAGNISEVCKRLQRNRNCCGLVDEDPGKTRPTYMVNLLKNSIVSDNHDIKIAHDRRRNNYLIVLCPRLEEWFHQTARILRINLEQYRLPNDPEKLHAEINANLNKFESFLDDVLSQNHPRITELRRALTICLNT